MDSERCIFYVQEKLANDVQWKGGVKLNIKRLCTFSRCLNLSLCLFVSFQNPAHAELGDLNALYWGTLNTIIRYNAIKDAQIAKMEKKIKELKEKEQRTPDEQKELEKLEKEVAGLKAQKIGNQPTQIQAQKGNEQTGGNGRSETPAAGGQPRLGLGAQTDPIAEKIRDIASDSAEAGRGIAENRRLLENNVPLAEAMAKALETMKLQPDPPTGNLQPAADLIREVARNGEDFNSAIKHFNYNRQPPTTASASSGGTGSAGDASRASGQKVADPQNVWVDQNLSDDYKSSPRTYRRQDPQSPWKLMPDGETTDFSKGKPMLEQDASGNQYFQHPTDPSKTVVWDPNTDTSVTKFAANIGNTELMKTTDYMTWKFSDGKNWWSTTDPNYIVNYKNYTTAEQFKSLTPLTGSGTPYASQYVGRTNTGSLIYLQQETAKSSPQYVTWSSRSPSQFTVSPARTHTMTSTRRY